MTDHPTLYRSVNMAVGEGRTIVAPCIVPYNRVARVADPGGEPYDEMFLPGAFERALKAPQRVLMRGQHGEDFLSIAGRATSLADSAEQLAGEFLALDSTAGDQVLALVRAGIFTGASVGFIPYKSRLDRGVTVRVRAHLDHVAFVMDPAYTDAAALAVRSESASRLDEYRPRPDPDLDKRLTDLGLTR